MSSSQYSRKFSSNSETALTTLKELSESLSAMENKVRQLEVKFVNNSNNSELRIDVKNQVVQLFGDLDRLQFNEIDGIITAELNSGKKEAKDGRKSLNAKCELLRSRIMSLYNYLQ